MSDSPRNGPSTFSITIGGIISFLGLLGAGVTSYTEVKSEIAVLRRGAEEQGRINSRVSDDVRESRTELRESLGRIDQKVDRIIEHLPYVRNK